MKLLDRTYIDLRTDWDGYHEDVSWNRGNQEVRAKRVAEWIEPGSSVLDAGCGEGISGSIIAEASGATVHGCDVVDVTKGRVPFVRVDLNDGLSAIDRRYDYVVFTEVIEHLLYPQRALRDAARIANKGVIVTIPNSGYLTFRLQLLFGVFPRQSFTHIHYWTYKDFFSFCRQIGLEVADVAFSPTTPVRQALKRAAPNLFAYQLYFLIAPIAPSRDPVSSGSPVR